MGAAGGGGGAIGAGWFYLDGRSDGGVRRPTRTGARDLNNGHPSPAEHQRVQIIAELSPAQTIQREVTRIIQHRQQVAATERQPEPVLLGYGLRRSVRVDHRLEQYERRVQHQETSGDHQQDADSVAVDVAVEAAATSVNGSRRRPRRGGGRRTGRAAARVQGHQLTTVQTVRQRVHLIAGHR